MDAKNTYYESVRQNYVLKLTILNQDDFYVKAIPRRGHFHISESSLEKYLLAEKTNCGSCVK